MNNYKLPAEASEFKPKPNPCYGLDATVATLNVVTADEHSYLLPYAQFLYADTMPNPALEHNADAPPEQILIYFAAAEVKLLGSGLTGIEQAIQKYELKFVKAGDRSFPSGSTTHVAAVTVNFTKEEL
jgi:hypothetical protein